ncbi:hypothetical protein FCV62_18990 [Vibrio kanaloae]|uniref:hypothetical protein n=1 Tax=Vibrio kanaloae TaxID=170673 RepID=UPI0010BE4A05|nr:hypothetical protein [Vibrio kanaloae]TKF76132.1 hypothetical protein FCV62_18990 [Vibrio kanaloae]
MKQVITATLHEIVLPLEVTKELSLLSDLAIQIANILNAEGEQYKNKNYECEDMESDATIFCFAIAGICMQHNNICNAESLRDLQHIIDSHKNKWDMDFSNIKEKKLKHDYRKMTPNYQKMKFKLVLWSNITGLMSVAQQFIDNNKSVIEQKAA